MKKVISLATSFLLGFAFFAAGGAIASEVTGPTTESELIVEVVETTETATETTEATTESPAEEVPADQLPYCFNVGKGSELNNDCFCVQDLVSTMAEVDCLIASGVVPASSYEAYRQFVLGE
jgi:hypothetical protein